EAEHRPARLLDHAAGAGHVADHGAVDLGHQREGVDPSRIRSELVEEGGLDLGGERLEVHPADGGEVAGALAADDHPERSASRAARSSVESGIGSPLRWCTCTVSPVARHWSPMNTPWPTVNDVWPTSTTRDPTSTAPGYEPGVRYSMVTRRTVKLSPFALWGRTCSMMSSSLAF